MSSSTPRIRGALSRMAARVTGSRFAKPVARVVLVAAGLVLLAIIGRASAAGALGFAPPAAPTGAPQTGALQSDAGAEPAGAAAMLAPGSSPPLSPGIALPTAAGTSAARGRASSDDPVILNSATVDDLRRLPGIGQKRADAILALRAHLGRFRAIEDLMKVKGIGRAMLKRLRPLVRLDAALAAPALADAGSPPPTPR
jgi:competence protein ComEA